MEEQGKQFCEVECTPGEDAVKTAEMTRKDLEHSMNFVGKAAAESERIDSSFERSSSVGKILPNIPCYREIVLKEESVNAANFIIVLRNCHSHLNLEQPPC